MSFTAELKANRYNVVTAYQLEPRQLHRIIRGAERRGVTLTPRSSLGQTSRWPSAPRDKDSNPDGEFNPDGGEMFSLARAPEKQAILDRIVPSNEKAERRETFNSLYTKIKDDLNPIRVLRNLLSDNATLPAERDADGLRRDADLSDIIDEFGVAPVTSPRSPRGFRFCKATVDPTVVTRVDGCNARRSRAPLPSLARLNANAPMVRT